MPSLGSAFYDRRRRTTMPVPDFATKTTSPTYGHVCVRGSTIMGRRSVLSLIQRRPLFVLVEATNEQTKSDIFGSETFTLLYRKPSALREITQRPASVPFRV